MRFHPDVLAAHAEFGGDLEDMQRRYDAPSPEAQGNVAVEPVADLIARLTYRVNNPSAWDSFDDGASELIREAAAHIARCSPENIAALLDALESERSRADRLEKALTRCQHALAMLIDPNNERFNVSIQHAWAQCVEAETTARAALGKEDVSD